MKFKSAVLLCAAAVPALAMADDWTTSQGVSYLCGGVGGSSQDDMKAASAGADAQLVITAGPDRAYLSDVKLTVSGANKQQLASWQAKGPICLLKLPPGNYTVDASYRDEHRTVPVAARQPKAGSPKQQVINFKPS